MINSLLMENFQNHKKSLFNFSPGLNVIVGRSDEGKSAAIRALRWVTENTPRGIAFKNWGAGKKDDVKVKITTPEGTCLRMKRNENDGGCYILNGDDENPYKALRTDVPESIADFLRIAPYQIRSQHDPFFLLSESPGPVAAKLNEVAGLAMASTSIKAANSLIRNAEMRKTNLQALVTENEDKLEGLEWVEDADTSLQRLERYQTKLTKVELKNKGLTAALARIIKIQDELDKMPDLEALTASMNALEKGADELTKNNNKQKRLSTVISRHQKMADEVHENENKERDEAVMSLLDLIPSFKKTKNQIKGLSKILKSLSVNEGNRGKASEALSKATDKLAEKMKGKCALCGK